MQLASDPSNLDYASLVSRSPTLFLRRSIIAFSISVPLEKGSARVYRAYSIFTLMNVLIIQLSLWPRALKRWFFMLRDEMEFGKVVTWISRFTPVETEAKI